MMANDFLGIILIVLFWARFRSTMVSFNLGKTIPIYRRLSHEKNINTVWLFAFFSTFCAFGLLEGMA